MAAPKAPWTTCVVGLWVLSLPTVISLKARVDLVKENGLDSVEDVPSAAWYNGLEAEIGKVQPQRIFSKDTPVKEHTEAEFRKWGESLRKQFNSADPFPSLELASLLNETLLRDCVASVKAVPLQTWRHEDIYPHTHNKHRLANSEWAHTPECKMVAELQANPLLTQFMKGLSGVDDLKPKAVNVFDSTTGWPLIGIASGGYLSVHSDYNFNPKVGAYRFLTMMLYLNDDWQADYGGDLEIYTQVNPSEKPCSSGRNPEIKFHHKVAPSFNKAFIWKNTPYAYHGHPTPVAAPDNKMRLAMQYIWFRKTPDVFPDQPAIFCVECDQQMATVCEANVASNVSSSNVCSRQEKRVFKGQCVCAVN